MHPMFIMAGLLHATVAAVLAFFVLFAAQKAEKLVKLLGNVLGVWLLILALLGLVGGAGASMLGGRFYGFPMGAHMGRGAYACPWAPNDAAEKAPEAEPAPQSAGEAKQ